MARDTQLAGISPGAIESTFLVKPKSASLLLIARDSEGSVLGETEWDMNNVPQWAEYLMLAYGLQASDVERVLLAIDHHVVGRGNSPADERYE